MQFGMDADHEKICKFERIDGDDYEPVAYNIGQLAERAVKSIAERHRLDALSNPIAPLALEQQNYST
jgi:hypothetical protein